MSESEHAAFGSGVHVYNCDGGLTVGAMKAIDDSRASATGVGNLINGVVLQWLTTLGVVTIVVQVSCSKQEISSLIPSEVLKVWEHLNSNKEPGLIPKRIA